MYVQALLDVHNKYAAMVESSFTGDGGFLQSLDKVGGHCVWGSLWGGSILCDLGGLCLRLLSRWSSICITTYVQTYCKSRATQFSGCILIAGLWSFCEQQCSDTRSQGFLQVTRAAGQIL